MCYVLQRGIRKYLSKIKALRFICSLPPIFTKCQKYSHNLFIGVTGVWRALQRYHNVRVSACRDTYTEKKNQLSFGGKEMKNISTVEGCKNVCNKMADCVGIDYNTKTKECYTHDEESFKFIATNPDVIQYTRVKCVEPTTTSTCVKLCFLL